MASSRRFFDLYQYLAPVVLFPLSYWLWFRVVGDHRTVLEIVSIPVVAFYVIPALGTNKLGLWEFNTRHRIGGFRIQHGFVFGSATSLISALALGYGQEVPLSAMSLLRAGLFLGALLGIVNWWYDIVAIKAEVIRVYTRAAFEGRGAEAIATEYAPVYFGTFGFLYGLYLAVVQSGWFAQATLPVVAGVYVLALGAVLVGPVLAFVCLSLATTGKSGLQSYRDATYRDAA
ncbi:MAG: hypothetical protein FJZ01_05660 [Candidatus Sericytochromatia bacterium]|nr:hypothetical protein [Candidatus Tanganyikabacteria bacterium]